MIAFNVWPEYDFRPDRKRANIVPLDVQKRRVFAPMQGRGGRRLRKSLGMNREYHKFYSHPLQRDMEFLVYGHAGIPLLVFPTSCGRFLILKTGA